MKKWVLFGFGLLLWSCSAQKINPAVLPKDISEKPEPTLGRENDELALSKLETEIKGIISSFSCKNSSDWAFAPFGAKACGGPVSYIAYPKAKKHEVLQKLEQYKTMQENFNRKYEIVSDCAMVEPPSGILCVENQAILVNQPINQVQKNPGVK